MSIKDILETGINLIDGAIDVANEVKNIESTFTVESLKDEFLTPKAKEAIVLLINGGLEPNEYEAIYDRASECK